MGLLRFHGFVSHKIEVECVYFFHKVIQTVETIWPIQTENPSLSFARMLVENNKVASHSNVGGLQSDDNGSTEPSKLSKPFVVGANGTKHMGDVEAGIENRNPTGESPTVGVVFAKMK